MLELPMPVLACPACGQQTARHLDEASKSSYVSYYLCRNCEHIWTINKQNPSIVTHVTPLPKKPDA